MIFIPFANFGNQSLVFIPLWLKVANLERYFQFKKISWNFHLDRGGQYSILMFQLRYTPITFFKQIPKCPFRSKSGKFDKYKGWKVKEKSDLQFIGVGTNWKYPLRLTLIGIRQGKFTSLIILGMDFGSWIFIKIFQTVLEVKIENNRDNLTSCQAEWVL